MSADLAPIRNAKGQEAELVNAAYLLLLGRDSHLEAHGTLCPRGIQAGAYPTKVTRIAGAICGRR